MKNFVKKGDLNLVNGGYLVTGEKETPVSNLAFVTAQTRAEYVVTFANLAKGRTFVNKKADSLSDLVEETNAAVAKNKPMKFVEVPTGTKGEITEKLKEEALNFINFKEKSSKVEKINAFLQEFKILGEFEEFGLFFEEGVTKLNKIYTLKEVIDAVTATVDLIS